MKKQPTCPKCRGPLVCLPCERASRVQVASDLRKARERAGISLRAMARRLGVGATYLSQFETGKTPAHGLKVAYLAELARQAAPRT